MDPRRLDTVAKVLGRGLPRRTLLLGLLAFAGGGLRARFGGARHARAAQIECGVTCLDGQILDETCTCIWVEAVGCEGLTDCGGLCVDLASDPYNCGGCSIFCDSGACSGGVCVAAAEASNLVLCGPALTDCSGFCVDLFSDPYHCGACWSICESGVCASGTCTASPVGCAVGLTDCSGTCIDIQTDPLHCGGCGVFCESVRCTGGMCEPEIPLAACTAPLVDCYRNGTCVDPTTDPANCGQCGLVCESGICAGGVCSTGSAGCAAGLIPCSGVCIDITSDARHCGGCGNYCTSGLCRDSECSGQVVAFVHCPAPLVDCGSSDSCSDPSSDARNCGACGNACPEGTVCIAGACCQPTILANGIQGLGCREASPACGSLTACNGVCVDVATDRAHCGACGNTCQVGQNCTAGDCVTPPPTGTGRSRANSGPAPPSSVTPSPGAESRLTCAAGRTACNGSCVSNCERGKSLDRTTCRCIVGADEGAEEVAAGDTPPAANTTANKTPTPESSPSRARDRDGTATDRPRPDGVWVHPRQGFRGDCLHLAALAYPFNPRDPSIEGVEFTVWYPGKGWTTACTVARSTAEDPDRFECVWDHAEHQMPEGQVEVSFMVYDAAGNQTMAPDGVRRGEYRRPSSDPRLQFPTRGRVHITGDLPGEGEHTGPDRYAVDLESDDPAVFPAAPGTVAFAGEYCEKVSRTQLTCLGTTVAIDHGGGWYSIYAHLADDEFLPTFGNPVDVDTRIGTMSDTGCYDNAGRDHCGSRHLHFVVHRGATCLVGDAPLWKAEEPIDVWGLIPGLPNPPATGPV